MHFFKRFLTISAAAAAISVSAAEMNVQAAEMPTDIHLTVETKEIAIEDIPEDRRVSLNVYTENCPPFKGITLYFTKDTRLEYYPDYECFSIAEGVVNARKPNVGFYEPDPNYRMCDICSSLDNDNFIELENAVVRVKFRLPEQVSPGDFFGVELLRSYMDMPIQIGLGDKKEDYFRDTPFTQLNGGGIRIVQKEQPAPVMSDNGGNQGGAVQNGGVSQDNSGETPQAGGNTAPQETTAITENTVVTSTGTTSKTATTTQTSTKITSVTSSSVTTTVISTGAPQKEGPKNSGGLLFRVGMITLIAAAVSALTLLTAKFRMNKK